MFLKVVFYNNFHRKRISESESESLSLAMLASKSGTLFMLQEFGKFGDSKSSTTSGAGVVYFADAIVLQDR